MTKIKITSYMEEQILDDIRSGEWTNEEVADRWGISPASVSRIRNGGLRNINPDKVPRKPGICIDRCLSCKWWQRLGSSQGYEKFCSYCYHTGMMRKSNPAVCDKWEERPEGYIAPPEIDEEEWL